MAKKFGSIEERRAYNRAHEKVGKERGKASEWTCVSCRDVAAEWALVHGAGIDDIYGYQPMCHSCHQKYDNRWSPEERAKISEWARRHWEEASPELRDSMTGNATGKRTPEQRARIGAAKIGNSYASGERTPEQKKRIREGRWGKGVRPE